ncbi:YcnI family protein [Tumebacillus sp. ITR2]|uniref:YcnI family protein n=1 Tax=Tumebacillus amylolyticus TaxID=2801339 RepID=A0ABS1JA99_9BACL|nr:YcnI family protein [Tumebacillus amylolyticus]MBL0387198.1 YcnI family protein [Tumebacillus amylolyticus]
MKKLTTALLLTAALTWTTAASAHVTVWPKETTTGAYEKYTVRVPVEKDLNTTKVRVEFPTGVKVSTVQPMAGWDYAYETNPDGTNKAITWTATAGGLKKGEFAEFNFIGANPKEVGSGKLAWKAYQTYADNSVVEWTGEEGSKTPASVTTIKAASGTETGNHDDEKTTTPATPAADNSTQTSDTTSTTSNTVPYILSGAALLLALISLFRKRA